MKKNEIFWLLRIFKKVGWIYILLKLLITVTLLHTHNYLHTRLINCSFPWHRRNTLHLIEKRRVAGIRPVLDLDIRGSLLVRLAVSHWLWHRSDSPLPLRIGCLHWGRGTALRWMQWLAQSREVSLALTAALA